MDKSLTTRYDYDENGNVIYKGRALPGTLEEQEKWQIIKFVYDNNKNVIATLFPEGSENFVFSWANREQYPYK